MKKKKVYLDEVEAANDVYGKSDQEMSKEEYEIPEKQDEEMRREAQPDMEDEETVFQKEEKLQRAKMPGVSLEQSAKGSMTKETSPKGAVEKKTLYTAPQMKVEPWENIVRRLKMNKGASSTEQLYKYKSHPEFKRIKKLTLGY